MNKNVIPTLSIVIITYNRVKFLRSQVESILASIKEWGGDTALIEVVISDNASTDETKIFTDSLQLKSELNLLVVRQTKNIGMIKNAFSAYEKTKGHWVIMCGDDDEFHINGIINIFNAINDHQSSSLVCFWNNSMPLDQWAETPRLISLATLASKYFYYPGNCGFSIGCGDAIRKAVYLYNKSYISPSSWFIMDVLGAACADSKEDFPIVLRPEIISIYPNHSKNTLYSSYYLLGITYLGLIKSAINVDKLSNVSIANKVARSQFGGINTIKKFKNIFFVHLESDLENDKNETLSVAWKNLIDAPIYAKPICFLIITIFSLPEKIKLSFAWIFLLFQNPKTASKELKLMVKNSLKLKAERRMKIAQGVTGVYTKNNL
jgi:glycosyltransferase involved in cell wall biosynthesis